MKIKTIIAVGGTGGHVLPGCSLADHLNTDEYDVELVTDKRGFKFLKEHKDFNIYTLLIGIFIIYLIYTTNYFYLLLLIKN